MTKEDKELLLRDLCCRLPYGVITQEPDFYEAPFTPATLQEVWYDNLEVKPYLRLMSSMTEEEIREYKCMNDALDENYEVHFDNAYPAFDFLNSHHFDYRGLIEKGLALEAPEGMYNINKDK